ncbi:hypothetical protein [Candidatus Nitrosotalea okcheonensis]|uniref:Uncharacterized protein n=1 Tax=Candidatus Nitrosotalea okcheonensis TaxID=1903276 RepID=A0A2H1FBR6_9ARCH|nr:hypothetical protein [Candidatus Nitrosotalea okcheonensis]SMH70204.1 conserved protein of unknown function [Candidatus Nitrosotalea okcheonensis]
MDVKQIPNLLSLSDFPVGFGGCRNDGTHFECCEYDILVIDGQFGESIHHVGDDLVRVHHHTLDEFRGDTLYHLQNMNIINDTQWTLRMLLSTLKEKKERIAMSYAQSCLVDAGILANKARDSTKLKDPFAGVWLKCAAYFLADAIFSLNLKRPSPTHMLEIMRNMKKDKTNQKFSIIHQILGIERSSTSLLSRMAKSTIGFSDMVENNGNSEIIQKKYDYLVENSLLSDCYFYFGYVNRNNILKIRNKIHHNPEFIHVLKIGFDIESDPMVVDNQATMLIQTTNEILGDKNLTMD